jgi:hypothetical protein
MLSEPGGKLRVMHPAQIGGRLSVRSLTVGFLPQRWDRQITAIRIDDRFMRKHPSRSHLSHLTQSRANRPTCPRIAMASRLECYPPLTAVLIRRSSGSAGFDQHAAVAGLLHVTLSRGVSGDRVHRADRARTV